MSGTDITVASKTDAGRVREHNEDSLVSWVAPPEADSPLGVRAILAVADGMGGHQRGEQASAKASALLERVLTAAADRPQKNTAGELAEYLTRVVEWINLEVFKLGDDSEDGPRPGTTLTAVVVQHDAYVVVHIGDSRAYLLRDGRLEQLTTDHTLVEEHVRSGQMTPDQARRSPFRGQLTRCLGVTAQAEVSIATGWLMPGDRLLVCSDGLTEYAQTEELAEVLQRHPNLSDAANHLVDLALQRGGEDNVTVVLAQVGSAPTMVSLSKIPSVDRHSPTVPTELPSGLGDLHRFPLSQRQLTILVGGTVLCALVGLTVGRVVKAWHTPPAAPKVAPAPRAAPPVPHRPIAVPSATTGGTTAPAPAAGATSPTAVGPPVKIVLQADQDDVLVEPAVKGNKQLKVTKAKASAYEPDETDDGWAVTLKSNATRQAYAVRPIKDGQPGAAVKEGRLSKERAEVELPPGKYRLEISGRPIADVDIAGR